MASKASRSRKGSKKDLAPTLRPLPPLVSIIMGSKSDWETMRSASEMLTEFGVAHETRVISAHRTPELMAEFASGAEGRGIEVIIAGAGGAAHLPGMTAAHTTLPVLGVPVESKALKGLDSLLSIVQMPAGEVESFPRAAEAQGSRRATGMTGADAVKQVLPGSTIGVLGSGQLGRMFALAARRMGYRVHTYSPDRDSPTGQIADLEVDAAYEDLDRVRAFASAVDVVTFEFENVPAATASAAAECALVRPAGEVLHTTQNRLREKVFLTRHGFPVTQFQPIRSAADIERVVPGFGPAILKTAGFGYDGKGQYRVSSLREAQAAWEAMGGQEAVLEALVDFEAEISVVGVRDVTGDCRFFAPSLNQHVNGILDVSSAPAPVPQRIADEAVEITRGVLEQLRVTGVLCVEFFLTRSYNLLVNEIAPRPHNSGHLTIDACITSQFEQQLRSVCGLPLGSVEMFRPAAMANLLGDLWELREPKWTAACARPELKLHLYGKSEPRPGRKMGHLTATADSAEEAERIVREARARLVV
jgi:5-(carboxyamino)imidazole ribonucleotide synthase